MDVAEANGGTQSVMFERVTLVHLLELDDDRRIASRVRVERDQDVKVLRRERELEARWRMPVGQVATQEERRPSRGSQLRQDVTL